MPQRGLLVRMHQIFLIVSAGLAVTEGETAKLKVLQEKIHTNFHQLVKDYTVPAGMSREHLSQGTKGPISGTSLWNRWWALKREIVNHLLPVWMRLCPENKLPSGKDIDTMLLAFRQAMFEDVQQRKDKAAHDKCKDKMQSQEPESMAAEDQREGGADDEAEGEEDEDGGAPEFT